MEHLRVAASEYINKIWLNSFLLNWHMVGLEWRTSYYWFFLLGLFSDSSFTYFNVETFL